jgi:hypothetical protein
MKKIKSTYLLLAIMAATCIGGMFTSCTEDINLLELPYLFRPINLDVAQSGVKANITWSTVSNATNYTVEIYSDSLAFDSTNLFLRDTTSKTSYLAELAGETRYSVRIRANAADSTKSSKFNGTLTFKTPAENIFTGYSSYMDDIHKTNVKWLPGANVTHLVYTAVGLPDSTVAISASEALAGEKEVSALPNANYTVKIYNKTILRGTVKVLVEGDVFLSAAHTGDLVATLNNATAGQVIVLDSGAVYTIGTVSYLFNKNIKVRGRTRTSLPVICMATGTTSGTAMIGIDTFTVDKIAFENIDFTGYVTNNTSATKIDYLINNGAKFTLETLSFTNCKIHNFGRTPMRLKDGKEQKINNLIYDNCIINEIGFGSTYALVNVNTKDYITNISFNNCTMYNFKGSLILKTGAYPMGKVSLTNCTINQADQDPATRLLFDFNTAVFSATDGITIKNCIFGSTGPTAGGSIAAGMRSANATVTVTGCYYTTDYIDETPVGGINFSIKGKMASYSGASTALWNNPLNGVFTLKDASFAGKGVAGDPRWY